MTEDNTTQGYSLKAAAEMLGVSEITIRRYIKAGKLRATLRPTKYGEAYSIEDIPPNLLSKQATPAQGINYSGLISQLENANREAGYWRARAELAEQRLLLLEAPKQVTRQHWWQRLFKT